MQKIFILHSHDINKFPQIKNKYAVYPVIF